MASVEEDRCDYCNRVALICAMHGYCAPRREQLERDKRDHVQRKKRIQKAKAE